MSFISQVQAWCMKNRLVFAMGALLVIALIALTVNMNSNDSVTSQPDPLVQETTSSANTSNTSKNDKSSTMNQQPTAIIVDIKGAVKQPNTYQMMSNDRIKQLLDKAVPLPTADLSQINLAEKLSDQKMIYIPQKGEQPKGASSSNGANTSSANGGAQGQPINLNTAQANDLTNVPGIGPAKAQAIIAYREEKGQFQSVEELKQVKGIGDKTYENLSSYFTV